MNCGIIQSIIGKVPPMQEHQSPKFSFHRTIQKQRYLTCNFMYSFSFFFISCSCWVFTCFNTIQWSDWQESEAYSFWSRVIQIRRISKVYQILTWLPITILWNSSLSCCSFSIWAFKAAVFLASYTQELNPN